MREVSGVVLRPERRLVAIRREKDSRSHGYVVSDRVAGTLVLCCQRLPLAASYISSLGGTDRVSVASLYESATLNRLVHRRWKVERMPLEAIPEALDVARRGSPNAKVAVLTHPYHLSIA